MVATADAGRRARTMARNKQPVYPYVSSAVLSTRCFSSAPANKIRLHHVAFGMRLCGNLAPRKEPICATSHHESPVPSALHLLFWAEKSRATLTGLRASPTPRRMWLRNNLVDPRTRTTWLLLHSRVGQKKRPSGPASDYGIFRMMGSDSPRSFSQRLYWLAFSGFGSSYPCNQKRIQSTLPC